MPNVTKKNLMIIKSIIVWKWKHHFTKNYFRKKKINCHGFMPGDFQVICGSMVSKNRRSPASAETPGYTLMTFLTMLSVILLPMLMILLFILSVNRHLICGNNLNWLLNLNLIYETLWTGARSGLLISMLGKFSWSNNTGFIDVTMNEFVLEEK